MVSLITTTVQQTVTKTLASSGTATSTARVAPQGGILEGGNPTLYNTKDPITIFIIQVRKAPYERDLLTKLIPPPGWYNNNILSPSPLASPKAPSASCHR